MKRKHRNTVLCILALAVFLLSICGCHEMYPIKITIPDETQMPAIVDILLPMEEDSPVYRTQSYEANLALDMGENEILLCELYRYHEDGYRSMLCHYSLSDYRIEKHADGSAEVRLYMNGKNEFAELCDRFQTFKVASADEDGNVLYVSEAYRFEPHGNVYLEGLTFDFEARTVEVQYHYDRPFWLELLEMAAEAGIQIMPVAMLAWFVFVVIMRIREGRGYPNLWFSLPFVVGVLPLAAYFSCRLDYALKTERALESIWTDFLSLGSPWLIAYDLIPVLLLAGVFLWAAYLTNEAHTVRQDPNDQS